MRTHTTNTDIRVIVKMHRNGNSVKEITGATKIRGDCVQHVIDVKCAPAPAPAQEAEAEAEATPAKPTPVQKRVAQKNAAKKAVDPIS